MKPTTTEVKAILSKEFPAAAFVVTTTYDDDPTSPTFDETWLHVGWNDGPRPASVHCHLVTLVGWHEPDLFDCLKTRHHTKSGTFHGGVAPSERYIEKHVL